MKITLIVLILVNLATSQPDVVGIYEYQSLEETENHYIIFDKLEGVMRGTYFGTHDGKGHGVFFYKSEMEKLKIQDNGEIEFEIESRLLYETNQFKIKDPEPDSSVGKVANVLSYHGHITENTLILKCHSEFNDCWENELVFNKISDKDK